MRKVFIYALTEPNDKNAVRYIGKSVKPNNRYIRHIQDAQNSEGYTRHHNTNWLKKLLRNNTKPSLIVLEECTSKNWQERECYWISYYKKQGVKLNNHTAGGEGPETYQHTEDAKENMRKPKSELHKRHISEGRKEIKFSEEHKENLSKSTSGNKNCAKGSSRTLGVKYSEESKKRMSLAQKKAWKSRTFDISNETRKKLSEAGKGRPVSQETREKIRQSLIKRRQVA